MTTDHLPDGDAIWGSPPSTPPRPWGRHHTLMAAGIAAAIAALGGAAIYAATGTATSVFVGPPGAPSAGPGGAPPAAMGQAPGSRDGQHGAPVHGQVVVADGSGGFMTVLSQSGTITATTPDSITVRSADGYTQTWATSAGQGAKFDVDDSVMVQGEQTGAATTPTVTEVLDPQRMPR